MTTDDAPEFFEALCRMAVTLGEDLPLERQEAYFHALRDVDAEQVLDALTFCARECKFFPRPAEIRERCRPTRYDGLGALPPRPYVPIPDKSFPQLFHDLGEQAAAEDRPYARALCEHMEAFWKADTPGTRAQVLRTFGEQYGSDPAHNSVRWRKLLEFVESASIPKRPRRVA